MLEESQLEEVDEETKIHRNMAASVRKNFLNKIDLFRLVDIISTINLRLKDDDGDSTNGEVTESPQLRTGTGSSYEDHPCCR